MAFVAQQQFDEEEEGQGSGANSPMLSASGGGALSSGTGTLGANATSALGRTQGPFVNLSQYLDANQGKIEPYSQKLVGGVNQSVQDAKGTIGRNEEEFRGDVSRGTTQLNPALASKSLTDIAGNEELRNEFVTTRDAQYRGPERFNANQQAQVNRSVLGAQNRLGNLLDQRGGLQTEVTQASRAPTAGKTAFNAALVGGSDEARNLFAQNRDEQRTALDNRLEQLARDKEAAVAEARRTTDEARTAVQSRLEEERTNLTRDRDAGLAQAQAEFDRQVQMAQAALTRPPTDQGAVMARRSGMPDMQAAAEEADAAALGITADQLNMLRRAQGHIGGARAHLQGRLQTAQDRVARAQRAGVVDVEAAVERDAIRRALSQQDPSLLSYLQINPANISAETVATPEMFSRVSALNQLAGVDSGILNPALAGQAQSFTRTPTSFDFNRAYGDLLNFVNSFNVVPGRGA